MSQNHTLCLQCVDPSIVECSNNCLHFALAHTSNLENLDNYYMSVHEWSEDGHLERPLTRCRSARAPRTPRALSPRRKSIVDEEEQRVQRNNERNTERNRRASAARPASAREPARSACSRRGSILSRPAFTVY